MNTYERKRIRLVTVLVMLVVAFAFTMPEVSEAAPGKPATVTGIKVSSTAYNSVTIRWYKARYAKKYEIYRATKRGGKYKKISTIKGVAFRNAGLTTGVTYWYRVRAVNGSRRGAFSRIISGKPALKRPQFNARSYAIGPKLTAGKVTGATGYAFYRDGKLVSKQKSLTFIDRGVAYRSSHTYKVLAYRTYKGRTTTSPFSRVLAASKVDPNVRLNNCNKVSSLRAGESFDLSGTITSDVRMKRVEIGIVDKSRNAWVAGAKYDNSNINAYVFDIDKAENSIRFGGLYGGTFSYRIYVHLEDGSVVTVLNHTFVVSQGTGAAAIVNMAKQCAWPYGTARSKYAYNGGSRTAAYTAALQTAYGSRSSWSAQTRAGASCDVFVGTVIRASGYDTKFPRGLDGVESHCRKNTDKWRLTGATTESGMKPGDIIFQLYNSGGGHIVVYLGGNRVANAHYNGKTYGIIENYSSQVRSKSKCRVFNVYRPIR